MADALGLGPSARKGVEVQLLSRAPGTCSRLTSPPRKELIPGKYIDIDRLMGTKQLKASFCPSARALGCLAG